MLASKWQRRLESASTQSEVIAIAREFVETISPFSMARLPQHCRPGEIENARDVVDYSLRIVRHHCEEDGATQRIVFHLADFFSAAAQRVRAFEDAASKSRDPR